MKDRQLKEAKKTAKVEIKQTQKLKETIQMQAQ